MRQLWSRFSCGPWAVALLWVMATEPLTVHAEPAPGDVFREYVWKGPWVNAGNWQRVTDPNAPHEGAAEFLPNPVNRITIDDLDQAVRAEVTIEQWGGHAGTSHKRLRLNDGEWMVIPEPSAIPGNAGQQAQAECYQYFTYPSVALPLDQIRPGDNTFEFTCDGQICYNFGWGQWGIYGVTFRVYYDDSKPHASGRLISPAWGASFGDSLRIALEGDPDIELVDFLALYEDFDYEGNGVYREWHHTYRYGRIQRHLGSVEEPPYAVTWHTEWVPDQPESVRIAARVRGANGVMSLTQPVGDLALSRTDRSVKLYKPFDVPGGWQTRAGGRQACKVFIPHDLSQALAAKMILTTWSGAHADAIGIGEQTVVARVGRSHDYSYDEIDVPLAHLHAGTMELFTRSATEHHGIEVLWPGICLKVQYSGQAPVVESMGGGGIYDEGLAEGWRLTSSQLQVDETSTRVAATGDVAMGLTTTAATWQLDLIADRPVPLEGYRQLHLAFFADTLAATSWHWLDLYINDQRVDLLSRTATREALDLDARDWQEITVVLDDLQLRFPYIESLGLRGRLIGGFHLDDIRLEPGSPTAIAELAAQPVPARPVLHPSYPNPFNGQATISFHLFSAQEADLAVYDMLGQRVATLANGRLDPGDHTARWDGLDIGGSRCASGVYVCRLVTSHGVVSRRLVLLR